MTNFTGPRVVARQRLSERRLRASSPRVIGFGRHLMTLNWGVSEWKKGSLGPLKANYSATPGNALFSPVSLLESVANGGARGDLSHVTQFCVADNHLNVELLLSLATLVFFYAVILNLIESLFQLKRWRIIPNYSLYITSTGVFMPCHPDGCLPCVRLIYITPATCLHLKWTACFQFQSKFRGCQQRRLQRQRPRSKTVIIIPQIILSFQELNC